MKTTIFWTGAVIGLAAMAMASSASAASCVGNCGTLGPDGVVTASPYSSTYGYVSTNGGVLGVGSIPPSEGGYLGTDGSVFTTSQFTATADSSLQFYFNYVTSDGSGFPDYAWSELETSTGAHVAWLFTAATQPSGNTSPGQNLPADDSTLTPASSAIIPGGPTWSPLGSWSGDCYDVGCGYTGWIESQYTIVDPGTYQIAFGVVNANDQIFDSGLAYNGIEVNGVGVNPGVPEPATWAMLIAGLFGVGASLRTARRNASVVTV